MSPLREHLIGTASLLIGAVFCLGTFAVYSVIYWSPIYAAFAIVALMVSTLMIGAAGYTRARHLLGFGNKRDTIQHVLAASLIGCMAVSSALIYLLGLSLQ
jgi:hypothetical protein